MKRHKSINLIFVTCLLMINGCKELPKPGNKIILLNDEILQSDSLRIMYQRNAIIYKPYEGFLIFTNDTVFTNPILTPTNSTSLIESDVLSHSDILNALDNSIEKVSYHIPIEDLNRKQNILSLLAKKYLLSQISSSEWELKDSVDIVMGRAKYSPVGKIFLIELKPE